MRLRLAVTVGAHFLRARFGRALNRGGSQRQAEAIGVPGEKAAGQRLVISHGRSCRQRVALTLRPIDLIPMTHHVECVALLEKTGSDLR